MLDAIRAYQDLLRDPPPTEELRLVALTEALDRLAMSYHQTLDAWSDNEVGAPESSEYWDRRAKIASRFPELGYYATIVPGPPDNLAGMVGDAIDDLADIKSDLNEVVWRAENVDLDDAIWYFRYLYRIHWGRHLMELRNHLHLRLFET
jgi:hypothetical protein